MDQPRSKYRHTRALLALAVADGLTQAEIARLCRVSQPIVSGWVNGKGLAFTHQVAELVRRYGHRLNRGAYRLYDVVTVDEQAWAASHAARALDDHHAWQLTRDLFGDGVPNDPGVGAVRRLARVTWASQNTSPRLVRVEGAVVWRGTIEHLYDVVVARQAGTSAWTPRRVPLERWVVHRAADGLLRVAAQHPRLLLPQAWATLRERFAHMQPFARRVHSADDAGAWLTELHGPFDVPALLAWVDAALAEHDEPNASATVPFLLRKALLEHGYEVDGVEVIV